MANSSTPTLDRSVIAGITVAALGYFVDVYDLILFSIVRTASLKGLEVPPEEMLSTGIFLLNVQMAGLLLGGILWGIWGDKRGRISVLFGSIFVYSAANIVNGFVQSVEGYALCRLIAGIGLAGELGAGITLVSESLPKEVRGYGTTVVATVGVAGAVVAGLVGDLFDWRVAYFIGGGLGFALLVLRIAVHESGLFRAMLKDDTVRKGDLSMLFRSRERFSRYLKCILSGVPIWFVVGILVTLSPEVGVALGMTEAPKAGTAVLWTYVGLTLGDLASGMLSQFWRSRIRAIRLFIWLTALFSAVLLFSPTLFSAAPSSGQFYALCLPLGFAVGYWAVFVTTAAEQFGTNLRATVATTAPNFVRGSTILITSLFEYLKPSLGIIQSAASVGVLVIALALWSTLTLHETFGKDLDFLEE